MPHPFLKNRSDTYETPCIWMVPYWYEIKKYTHLSLILFAIVYHNLFLYNQDQLYQSFWFIMQWLKLEEIFTYLEGGFPIRMVVAIRKKSTNWLASLEIVNGQHWSSKWKLPEHIRLSFQWMILFVHQIETPKTLYYSPRILILQLHF